MSRPRRNPLERFLDKPTRKTAIEGKCFDCMGQDYDPGWQVKIRECPQAPGTPNECTLWRWRPYQ